MQVKDVDTLYSDYMKVRDILKGNQLYITELEKKCQEVGVNTDTIQELRKLGQVKMQLRRDGRPNNYLGLNLESPNHYAAIGMSDNVQFYEDFKIENRLTKDNLLDLISQFYDQNKTDIKGKSRLKCLVICRQVYSALLRRFRPNTTLSEIGLFLGGRDHSTIINALQNHENDMIYAKGYKEEFQKLKSFLVNKL